MADVLIADSDNPPIHGAGEAVFGKNHYCLWETKDGSISILIIQNLSAYNTLTVVISGAPSTIHCTDGTLLNGKHTIPPNDALVAIGDFFGTLVTIFNLSALGGDCKVTAKLM